MPSKPPIKKRKYLWFKCVFKKLSVNFFESTAKEPGRYQKMDINIYKNDELVTKMVFHLWGIIEVDEENGTPFGHFNLERAFAFPQVG